MNKGPIAIAGVGYTAQGRLKDRTSLGLHLEASRKAILDAGLQARDIDGLICYRQFSPASDEAWINPARVAAHLGLSPAYLSQDAN